MTETEAKAKWCPMVRWGDMNLQGGLNRGNTQSMDCIGSACMMWRWDVVPEQPGGGKNWDGHCGLASAPPMSLLFVGTPPPLRPIGKGVYNNPQSGEKTDIGSGG